jgi:dolichol-phosphate mannosyltransferase
MARHGAVLAVKNTNPFGAKLQTSDKLNKETRLAQRNLRVLAVPVAFNEETKIGNVIDRFDRSDVDEILVVDDCSTDKTPELIRAHGAKIISHSTRSGVGSAIRTAITYARVNGFDVIVILAGNDKDRPQEIPRLLQPIIEERYDFVQGSRYLPGGDFGNMPLYRRGATQFVHPWLFSLLTRRRITDSTNGFRAFRTSLFDDPQIDINQDWLNAYELEPYLFYKAIRLGYKVKEVPVTKIYPPHELGYTKMKPITGWWSILRPVVYLGLGIKT